LRLEPSAGFTLIELVIVLTLLAILMAAAIPSVRGLKDEQIAREPITALSKLAKETRLQAMKDKRPYQIAFTSKGYTATRYLSPYMQAGQLEAFVTKAENDIQQREEAGVPDAPTPDNSSGFANPTPTDKPVVSSYKEWTQSYTLPEGVHYGAKFWYEPEPTPSKAIRSDFGCFNRLAWSLRLRFQCNVKPRLFQPPSVRSPLIS
jgi:prepilin-type N-terminal cleavage/methylation domain-containing protein